jgi:hypothetical protein
VLGAVRGDEDIQRHVLCDVGRLGDLLDDGTLRPPAAISRAAASMCGPRRLCPVQPGITFGTLAAASVIAPPLVVMSISAAPESALTTCGNWLWPGRGTSCGNDPSREGQDVAHDEGRAE